MKRLMLVCVMMLYRIAILEEVCYGYPAGSSYRYGTCRRYKPYNWRNSARDRQLYLSLLDAKLNEEVAEYQESGSLEELAGILEVIRAVAAARGSSFDEVEAIRQAKREVRGGFEQRILLEDVFEQGESV